MRKTILLVVTGLVAFQSSALHNPVNDQNTGSAGTREDLSTLAGSMLDETIVEVFLFTIVDLRI
jgi:hypothetical protein